MQRIVGFCLIEVLVAWFILTTIIFSILAMQTELLRTERHAYFTNLANHQIENLFERLRANSSESFRARELSFWNRQNSQLLPQGHGQYNCIENLCRVSISWCEQKEQTIILESLL